MGVTSSGRGRLSDVGCATTVVSIIVGQTRHRGIPRKRDSGSDSRSVDLLAQFPMTTNDGQAGGAAILTAASKGRLPEGEGDG